MGKPEGRLTPVQFEILQLLWDRDTEISTSKFPKGLTPPPGMTVAELWESIREDRDVSRTTVLNLVDRLEKRNWLRRKKVERVFRYTACVDRASTEGRLASDFVGEFFEGSPSSLVLSLLGAKSISKAELQRLKALLDDETSNSKSPKRKG